MKKFIKLLLMIIVISIPIVNAKSFKSCDDKVEFNTPDGWYTFTRENYKGNDSLIHSGRSESEITKLFETNNVYLYSFTSNSKKEFLIKRIEYQNKDFNQMTEDELTRIEDKFVDGLDINEHEKYEKDNYIFIRLEFNNSQNNKNFFVDEYLIAVDNYLYSFILQSTEELSASDKVDFKSRIDSLNIDGIKDIAIEEEQTVSNEENEVVIENEDNSLKIIIILIGVVIVILSIIFLAILLKERKK